MKYSDILLKEHPELWKSASEHPFISGLCAGTIPKEAFRQYVIQDYYICQAVRRLLALVVAKLPSTVSNDTWTSLVSSLGAQIIPGPEVQILQLFHKELGLTHAELTQAQLATRGFSDFIISTGYTSSYKQSLIVLMAIHFVNERWAEVFADANPGDAQVQKWIQVHRDRVLGPTVKMLKDALDVAKPHSTKVSKKHAEALKCTLQWETSFWDSLSGKYEWAV